MAKPLNDSALIKTIAASKTPLTADQIAASMKSLRHKVNPLLRGLVNAGQIMEVPATGDFPVRFCYRQTADGAQAQSDDNVVQLSSSRRKDDEPQSVAAPVVDKPAKPSAKRPGRPSLKAVSNSAISAKPALETPVKPSAPKADKVVASTSPASSPSAHSPVNQVTESMYNRVLRMLGQEPRSLKILHTELGAIDGLIAEMTEKGVIDSTYIMDSHVFDLTDAGQIEFEALPPLPQAPIQPEVMDVAPVISKEPAPAAKAPVVEVISPELPVVDSIPQAAESKPADLPKREEVQANLPLSEPIVASEVVAPEAAEQPKQQLDQALPENPIMVEMASLMERLVNERMGKIAAQVEQGQRDRDTLVKVGTSIKKATAALQLALDALNEIGDSIS